MEVFISYSTKDSTIANAVCAALENSGIGCFIAPRDIHPGLSYASEIIRGINEVKAFLVIISSNSNASEHVANEVEIAFNAKKTIIPFFVENVPMSQELKYYLSRKHWLIAYPHYEQQLPNLVNVISELLGVGDLPASSDKDNNIKTENGIANAENGKPDGVDDCPPVLRGTSEAEGVNDSPSTDDGETVVGNSSGSCHPERSEPSVDARRGQSQESYKHSNREILPPSGRQNDKQANPVILSDSEESYKHTNEEILPPSGRQNDNGGEMRDESGEVKDEGGEVKDESGEVKDESGEWRDERGGLGGISKKKWAIIIAVLVIGAVAALLGTLSGGGSDDTAAERERLAAIAEEQRIEAERLAAEQQRLEQERLAQEAAEQQRLERERKAKEEAERKAAAEAAEKKRLAAIAEEQRIEAERLAAEQQRLEQQRLEQERLAAERKAKEEAERKAAAEAAEQKRKEEERERQEAAQTRGTINGHDYVDLGLSVKWATCNVGASTPGDYGNYYAWGETATKSYYGFSTTDGEQMSSIAGNPTWDAAHKNWGSPWRLPTDAEFQELIDNCTWEWSTRNGHNGYKVTSKKNGNSIFLPAAGFRDGTSSGGQGSGGYYWSATPHEFPTNYAYNLYFSGNYRRTYWEPRGNGFSVRPVSE